MTRKDAKDLVTRTAKGWSDDHAARLAASLAYYTILSMAPLVVIAIAVAGFVFGKDAARGRVAAELGAVVGAQAAKGVEAIVANARAPAAGFVSTTIGVVVLLLGASGVFGELQASLNAIWGVEPKPDRGIRGVVKDRFLSFTMVLGVAFLLLVSLVVSAALSAAGAFLAHSLPAGELVWQVLNFAISIAIVMVLFGLIFKVVPDVAIEWRDVWPGALVTALLFAVGKYFLGLYLGRSALSSSYGAAGSLVALAVWVYYAAQILFVGAEFTRAQATRRGAVIEPRREAVVSRSTRDTSIRVRPMRRMNSPRPPTPIARPPAT